MVAPLLIKALRGQRQVDLYELQASQNYILKPYLNKQT